MTLQFAYPSTLPVNEAHDEIVNAIQHAQVVIISGETGSGKTTQIPKMLLEMGRGTHGKQIVHTQPRRLAARTVAERIASELGVGIGDEIGYQVRFSDHASARTRLKVVTDGILLAQIQHDTQLSQYDTIIIDEAHERSLNIDFLLGYLTALLPKRRDLKLIITSATIDSVKFQRHFEQALGAHVPIIEVSGRTYPVQIVYEPLGALPALMSEVPGFTESADEDMPTAVARACMELITHARHESGARDILVFAAGERDIHEYEQAIRRHLPERLRDTRRAEAVEIVALYARLSNKEQHTIFEPHTRQRIIIATNIAETSLTVPGIRYVVDPGMARISRYSKSAKVQRLPIEPISQASANQRAGRCGRVADGIAIRLYSLEDFETRPAFTEPEILRTSLGAVVLHMLAAGVARSAEDVAQFGFIDPPDMRAVSDGMQQLVELQAIERQRGRMRLTSIGKTLALIPIDIRLGCMILQAHRAATPNTLAAILVITAFLSLQDPRERPEQAQEAADQAHARYADAKSDFLSVLNLWHRLFGNESDAAHALSNAALRKICKTEFLNFLRVRQWKDLVTQLRHMAHDLHMRVGEVQPLSKPDAAQLALPLAQQAKHALACSWDEQSIHTAMLAGLLSMIGMQVVREPKASDFAGMSASARARALKRAHKQAKNEYQGARGTHFAIFPGSAVAASTPEWVMSSELVETSRLWARYCARIDPRWVEPLAANLTKTTYAQPHWSASRGAAVAQASVLLYGLPIITKRTVQWGAINPEEARDLLIREGLVAGEVKQRFAGDDVVQANRALLEQQLEQANRTRRAAQTITEEDLYDFYQSVVPSDMVSIAQFGAWWKRARSKQPQLLTFDPEQVERLHGDNHFELNAYPNAWHTVDRLGKPIALPLSYTYDVRSEHDGVSVHVPLNLLSHLNASEFTWQVPGMREELVLALIKALPKALRVQFVPAPDSARAIMRYLDEHYPQPGMEADDEPSGAGDTGNTVSASNAANTGASAKSDTASYAESQDDATSIPSLLDAFTQAAIAILSAPLHPHVIDATLLDKLSPYLRMTFVLERREHHRTQVLASSKSLQDLQRQFAQASQEQSRQRVQRQAQQAAAQGAVVKQAELLRQAGATQESKATLLWREALKQVQLPHERISSRWLTQEALALASTPYTSTDTLIDDLQLTAVKRLLPHVEQYDTDEAFALAVAGMQDAFEDEVYAVAKLMQPLMASYHELERSIAGSAALPLLSTLQSIREHAHELIYDGFLSDTPPEQVPQLRKYLQADVLRLRKAKVDVNRDVQWAWQAEQARELVRQAESLAKSQPDLAQREQQLARVAEARWLMEDYFVSLWAQELGTAKPVSLQRLRKLLNSR